MLIAGGYGLVGGQIARRLREAGHDLELVLAGRNPDAGAALAAELGATTAKLDVADPAPDLAALGPVDLVVAALQDPGDNLLMAALRSGAGHIGIVRTAESMASSAIAAAALAQRPALMLGHWQAGVLTLAALATARDFACVDGVAMAALYDYADPIGPMTANDAGGFVGAALIRRSGAWESVPASENGRSVSRAGQPAFDALPMGVLDTPALAAMTGARDARFDLGTGVSRGTAAGGAASHDLYIELTGRDAAGASMSRRIVVSDPHGQAHLTALGVLLGVERVLGLDGAPPPAAGLWFPEGVLDPLRAMARLQSLGVTVEAGA
ncbi:MAG TPA: hypothetical protein VGD44_12315 [Phenylobacterium sp.]